MGVLSSWGSGMAGLIGLLEWYRDGSLGSQWCRVCCLGCQL